MRHSLLEPCLLLLLLLALWSDVRGEDRRPNFVLIMVDDMGIGDVGCYGNDTIRTPNIDRLASEGVKLTQHIAASPVCTPSRTAFMTGRYAIRSGMAGSGPPHVLLFLGGSGGLPPSETTFAKRLQQQGYTTGLVGKWHLGVNCEHRGDHCHHPNHHGFSFFYGMPFTLVNDCVPGMGTHVMAPLQQTFKNLSMLLGIGLLTLVFIRACGFFDISLRLLAALFSFGILVTAVWYVPFHFLRRWNCIIMRDQEVVQQPMTMETLPFRMLTEAQQFVKRNAHQPFLLFFSLLHIHTPLFNTPAFSGKSRHGRYGDNMEELDWIVGELIQTVDSLGMANNTLIYLTSDHGGHLENSHPLIGQGGGWNGIYRGGKAMGGWEGGIRVPGIFRWPSRLAAGRVVDEPTSLMDLYPTLKYLAQDTQSDRHVDGHNLMPLLEGKVDRSEHEFMFHYCGSYLNAARWHPPGSPSIFKLHFFTPNFSPPGAIGCYDTNLCQCHGDGVTHHDPPLLYDLFHDPSESRPLSPDTEPRYAEVLHQTAKAIEKHQRSKQDVPNQMTWEKILWRPWLQPCCGTFPFCGCKEDTTPRSPRQKDSASSFIIISTWPVSLQQWLSKHQSWLQQKPIIALLLPRLISFLLHLLQTAPFISFYSSRSSSCCACGYSACICK
ncbi:arylsulfatase D isoform X1 [Dunckerocampus dactyliophorus]|uniref:arylsulfatase D isoform X1 n=2 Tax=Dunckerocampus dactyliophorus TaxID=161453 RepID=UPI0024053A74|nr:arylsulfatase D isoform X1 [Dunckerocampus dactyliophorus]